MLLALYLRAWRHVREARPTVGVYLQRHHPDAPLDLAWPVAAPVVLLGALMPFPASLLLTATYAVGILLLAAQGTRASRRPDTALAGAD